MSDLARMRHERDGVTYLAVHDGVLCVYSEDVYVPAVVPRRVTGVFTCRSSDPGNPDAECCVWFGRCTDQDASVPATGRLDAVAKRSGWREDAIYAELERLHAEATAGDRDCNGRTAAESAADYAHGYPSGEYPRVRDEDEGGQP